MLRITENYKVIKVYQSFVLGVCKCGCNTQIPIRNKKKLLGTFVTHHNLGKREKSTRYGNGHTFHNGYEYIFRPHHKYAQYRGYVKLARYLKELDLGRYLDPKEVVHHADLNKLNNEPDNLILFPDNKTHLAIAHNNFKRSGQ